MKQVTLNVASDKYNFFMELVKNFDFVSIAKSDKKKSQLLKEIAEGMHQANLAAKGKIKTRSIESLLDEL